MKLKLKGCTINCVKTTTKNLIEAREMRTRISGMVGVSALFARCLALLPLLLLLLLLVVTTRLGNELRVSVVI